MKEQLKMKQIIWKINLRDADNKIAVLKDKINDDVANATTRLCYAEKWLLARAEILDLEYKVPRPEMPRADHERRVHIELLKAYELQIKERETSLEYWERRYNTDIVIISDRLAEKSEQLRIATNRRKEFQKVYDLHEGEMRAWLTFKRERAARLAREERLRASVTRIQAWWRGVMVRRAFGAFRYLKNTKKAPTKSKKK
ncbi:dynein regulatory complex protein 9 [Manduca sexta]|uniref:dynein regulatory complex protein 9 n=1 Tax=Manduca sexta TaxID=7130 RepID=UPI0011832527|nr:dynein regulatory complex protein 9 [Manduca sexta]